MKDERGWLIETRDAENRIIWFGGIVGDSTRDPNDAIRFARERDAGKMLTKLKAKDLAATAFCASHSRDRPSLRPSHKWKHATVTEHEWPAPKRDSPTKGDRT